MLRLVRAELRRLAHRRTTIWTLAALLLALSALGYGAWKSSAPPTPAQQAAARQGWEEARKDWELNKHIQIQECERSNAELRSQGVDSLMECTEENLAPKAHYYGVQAGPVSQLTTGLHFAAALGLTAVCVVIGASFIGAEFSTGNMAGWLLQEPRRSRVFWAKLLTLAAASVGLCVVTCAISLAGIGAIGQVNGLAWDLTSTDQVRLIGRLALASLMAIAAGLAAAGLAFLTRHTAAVLGVMAALGVGSAILTGSQSRLQRFSLVNNVEAWVDGPKSYLVAICRRDGTDCEYPQRVLERGDAGLFLFGLAALAVALGWWSFRRRDVA